MIAGERRSNLSHIALSLSREVATATLAEWARSGAWALEMAQAAPKDPRHAPHLG